MMPINQIPVSRKMGVAVLWAALGWTAATLIPVNDASSANQFGKITDGGAVAEGSHRVTQNQSPADKGSSNHHGAGLISGKVVESRSGAAIPYVTVTVRGRVRAQRMTDRAGEFEFVGLPFGTYTASASKPGFVKLEYGQGRAFEPSATIRIEPIDDKKNISLALYSGGVISGKVTDAYSNPIPDASITASRYEYKEGKRTLTPVQSSSADVRTDERGRFRIVGMPSGLYVVSAKLSQFGADNGGRAEWFGETYSPSALSPDRAATVRVLEPNEVTANIRLLPTKMIRVSGFVVDEQGRKLVKRGGIVRVVRRAETATVGLTQLEPDASFRISVNDTVGEYFVVVSTTSMLGDPVSAPEAGRTSIVLNHGDVSGITVKIGKGATIYGNLIGDGNTPLGEIASSLGVFAQPLEPDGGLIGSISVPVLPDGRFILPNVFQPSRILVDFGDREDLRVERVVYNGRDVGQSGLNVTSGQQIRAVTVAVTSRVAALSGIVRNASNHPVPNCVVFAFSTDMNTFKSPVGASVKYVRADANGQYSIGGLAPGSYRIVALPTLDVGFATDPQFLRDLSSHAARAELTDKERSVDLPSRGGRSEL
jgi:hypothetical protein